MSRNMLDLIDENFDFNSLYKLLLPHDPRPHGHLFPSVVERLPWAASPAFAVDHDARSVVIVPPADPAVYVADHVTGALQTIVDAIVGDNLFGTTSGLHSEPYRICGAAYSGGRRPTIERYPVPLFGIASRGAHMTCYLRDAAARGGIRVWVARRSLDEIVYPGLFDTTVAGGIKADHSPLECIVAEAGEEACLDGDAVRARAVATGVVSYVSGRRDAAGEWYRAGPAVLYVYDMELGADEVPRPGDDEVEDFRLMDVGEITEAMLRGQFKPNCNLVMIDFFIRMGIITPDDDNYVEISTRLRRPLPVPMSAVGGDLPSPEMCEK